MRTSNYFRRLVEDKPIEDKSRARAKLERDVDEYLRNGGTITVLSSNSQEQPASRPANGYQTYVHKPNGTELESQME